MAEETIERRDKKRKISPQLAGKVEHTTRLPGIPGPLRLTADVGRSLAQGGEYPTSAEASTSRSPQPLSRCQESYKGQKSALTAVRQVGRRGVNT